MIVANLDRDVEMIEFAQAIYGIFQAARGGLGYWWVFIIAMPSLLVCGLCLAHRWAEPHGHHPRRRPTFAIALIAAVAVLSLGGWRYHANNTLLFKNAQTPIFDRF